MWKLIYNSETSRTTSSFKDKQGAMLVVVLVASGLFIVMLMGAISLALLEKKLNASKVASAQALYVAEAGVNYYRWALYHENQEYCNKETCIGAPDYGPYGPYSYTDDSGEISGSYLLYIVPPADDGSTIVNIRSMGWVDSHPNIKRSISVLCGIKSWSSFSSLSNSFIYLNESTEVFGHIHSNSGIRFDGVAHNLVTSSVLDFDDPDHSGSNEFGVHTHNPSDPLPDGNNPPQNVPSQPDVFRAGRNFPVPVVSFDLLSGYANDTLAKAELNGLVLPNSGGRGYRITLKTDNTMDIRTVDTTSPDCRCREDNWKWCNTYGILSESDHLLAEAIPANGIVFVKDNVWVDGQIDGSRVNIVAFAEPLSGNSTNIIINDDILYSNYDGSDAIGLVAQSNILFGLFVKDDLRVDAALIAKEGMWGRLNYANTNCEPHRFKTSLTIYGSLAARERPTTFYEGTYDSGFNANTFIYDNNLNYSPPPHFPVTGEYTFISWQEQ